MPVAQLPAITGKLRKRLILDLSVALGGGTVAGYGYWCASLYPVKNTPPFTDFANLFLSSFSCVFRYGVHLPSVQRRECLLLILLRLLPYSLALLPVSRRQLLRQASKRGQAGVKSARGSHQGLVQSCKQKWQ